MKVLLSLSSQQFDCYGPTKMLKGMAEGVESSEILDRVAELGCDIAQGYLIARPLPEHELIAALGESNGSK